MEFTQSNCLAGLLLVMRDMEMKMTDIPVLDVVGVYQNPDADALMQQGYGTTVEVEYVNGKVKSLKVQPEERRKDIVFPQVELCGSDANTQPPKLS